MLLSETICHVFFSVNFTSGRRLLKSLLLGEVTSSSPFVILLVPGNASRLIPVRRAPGCVLRRRATRRPPRLLWLPRAIVAGCGSRRRPVNASTHPRALAGVGGRTSGLVGGTNCKKNLFLPIQHPSK